MQKAVFPGRHVMGNTMQTGMEESLKEQRLGLGMPNNKSNNNYTDSIVPVGESNTIWASVSLTDRNYASVVQSYIKDHLHELTSHMQICRVRNRLRKAHTENGAIRSINAQWTCSLSPSRDSLQPVGGIGLGSEEGTVMNRPLLYMEIMISTFIIYKVSFHLLRSWSFRHLDHVPVSLCS